MLAESRTVRGLASDCAFTKRVEGPGGRVGAASRPRRPPRSAAGAASATDNPRTTQRIERQMNRNSSANNPYFSADSAKGVIVSASTPAVDTSVSPELDHGRADRDRVAVGELAGLDGLAVQAGPPRRSEVGQRPRAVATLQLGVRTGRALVLQHDV